MGRLFGTDGIRGIVNQGLDAQLAYKVGLAVARVLLAEKKTGKPVVTIGKDTRISSDLLEGALMAGLCSAGANIIHLGVLPTPGVAWVTIKEKADAGIVISASHNPYEHNGIKIFNGNGFKLSDELEQRIEDMVLSESDEPLKTHGDIGKVSYKHPLARDMYINHLVGTVESDLSGLRILVDCANGAASSSAVMLFDRFPNLHVDILNADPDGLNINTNCGSTHMGGLAAMVKAGGYDAGIAFDGDADRCLAVSEKGETIDGDLLLAACGLHMRKKGKLVGDTIVATVMSNVGLHAFAKEQGIQLLTTDVGDRNVLERMLKDGYMLGGEQSGHTIFLEYATTGDGQLTALQFLDLLSQEKRPASEVVAVCKQFPQVLVNVPVASKEQKEMIMASQSLKDATAKQEAKLGDGRILIRPSGTEALIRVMVEAETQKLAEDTANFLAEFIKIL